MAVLLGTDLVGFIICQAHFFIDLFALAISADVQ